MTSAYPAALDTLAKNKTDATTTATDHAAHHNDLADAANKIEAELGVDPSGSFATVAARFAVQSTVRKTADQSQSTTNFVNVTDLAFPVTANGDYFFEFFIPYSSSVTTTGVGFAVTCPTLASSGYISYVVDISGRATSPAIGAAMTLSTVPYHTHGQVSGGPSGSTIAPSSDAVALANVAYFARVEGICSAPSVDGTLQVQWRSETAAATTVKKGAFGRMYTN
jgi:hypothetical protein